MIKIMFVCHGNICRSPMAEFVLKDMVRRRGLEKDFVISSSATSTEEIWNGVGNPVYPPERAVLEAHGINPSGKRAVQLKASEQGNGNNPNHGLSWQILPLLFVKILVNPKGLTAFCALIKTKSAHDKLQSIKNAWSKDEICCLEMAALLTQGNSESDKYRFNTAFLTGSDYYRYPKKTIQ